MQWKCKQWMKIFIFKIHLKVIFPRPFSHWWILKHLHDFFTCICKVKSDHSLLDKWLKISYLNKIFQTRKGWCNINCLALVVHKLHSAIHRNIGIQYIRIRNANCITYWRIISPVGIIISRGILQNAECRTPNDSELVIGARKLSDSGSI